MSFLKDESGQVRLVWRLILIVLLYVSVAVLLRFIPIRILTAYLVGQGTLQTNALEIATEIIIENPAWSTALGIIFGLTGLFIVWILISKVEKTKFDWKAVGLDWKRNSLLMILLGALLAVLLCFGSIFTAYLLSATDISQIPIRINVSIPIFLLKLALFLAMGFGEEIVFRGYIQTRLVNRLRATWGILIAAVIFVLLHQIFHNLSPITILSGVMLWFTIGMLYHLSRSLYLCIFYHGVMNTLLNTLAFTFGEIESMIVHAFMLLFVVVIAIFMKKFQTIKRNNL